MQSLGRGTIFLCQTIFMSFDLSSQHFAITFMIHKWKET